MIRAFIFNKIISTFYFKCQKLPLALSSIHGWNIRFRPHIDYLDLHVKDPFVVVGSQNGWEPFLAKKIVKKYDRISFSSLV